MLEPVINVVGVNLVAMMFGNRDTNKGFPTAWGHSE